MLAVQPERYLGQAEPRGAAVAPVANQENETVTARLEGDRWA